MCWCPMRKVQCVATTFIVISFTSGCAKPAEREHAHDQPGSNVDVAPHPFYNQGQWGYIDNAGSVRIKPQFGWAEDFHDERAAVERGDPPQAGYIRPDGSWAASLPPYIPFPAYSDGRVWFYDGKRFGCMDKEGAVVIPPKYDDAEDFSEGLAVVGMNVNSGDTGTRHPPARLYGYVNTSGDLVIPLIHAWAAEFADGLAVTRRPGAKFSEYIDRNGRVVFSLKDLKIAATKLDVSASNFSCGRAWISIQNGSKRSFVLLDTRGKVVSEGLPYDFVNHFSDGLAEARSGSKVVAFLDTSGKTAFKREFDSVRKFHEGLCLVRVGGSCQFIDRHGAVALSPSLGLGAEPWNDATDFLAGLARVHVGGEFHDSIHGPAFWSGGTWFYIDRKGKTVAICRTDGEKPIDPPLGREHLGKPY